MSVVPNMRQGEACKEGVMVGKVPDLGLIEDSEIGVGQG